MDAEGSAGQHAGKVGGGTEEARGLGAAREAAAYRAVPEWRDERKDHSPRVSRDIGSQLRLHDPGESRDEEREAEGAPPGVGGDTPCPRLKRAEPASSSAPGAHRATARTDRKSTRLNSSH